MAITTITKIKNSSPIPITVIKRDTGGFLGLFFWTDPLVIDSGNEATISWNIPWCDSGEVSKFLDASKSDDGKGIKTISAMGVYVIWQQDKSTGKTETSGDKVRIRKKGEDPEALTSPNSEVAGNYHLTIDKDGMPQMDRQ